MSAPQHEYKLYHPKWYRRRMPIFWWLGRPAYAKFIVRELTSVFVAYAALLLVWQVMALGQGQDAHDQFVAWLQKTPVVIWHWIVLAAVVFHTTTWLNLAPQALVLQLGEKRVPDAVVRGAHYGAWLVASLALLWIFLGRGA